MSELPPELRSAVEKDVEGEYGDRRQELVFIGSGMDEATLTETLDGCLLTDSEMRLGIEKWPTAFSSPWPNWPDVTEQDHGHDQGEFCPLPSASS